VATIIDDDPIARSPITGGRAAVEADPTAPDREQDDTRARQELARHTAAVAEVVARRSAGRNALASWH